MLAKKTAYDDILRPKNHMTVEQIYEDHYKFDWLHQQSIKRSQLNLPESDLRKNGLHHAVYPSLSGADIDGLRKLVDTGNLDFNPQMLSYLKKVITPEIDQQIKQYFNSHYAIVFFAPRETTDTSGLTNPSTKWHCDVAPLNSMMLMCYLDDDSEHQSSTLFMNQQVTQDLKDRGYVYCLVENRLDDIGDLLADSEVSKDQQQVYRHAFNAGETIIFGAANVLHKAEVPKPGGRRRTLDIFVIPSPVPWEQAIAAGYQPGTQCNNFDLEVDRLMNSIDSHKMSVANANANATANEGEDYQEIIQLSEQGGISSKESLRFHIDSIFSSKPYAHKIFEQFSALNLNYNALNIDGLLTFIKSSFKDGLDWTKLFNISDSQNLQDLVDYERRYNESINRFVTVNKPKPEAVMWPIPDHDKYPRCKFDMKPYVQTHKIMDKNTPIGSAGSCFAVEIADVLQREKFNYVVTELGDSPKTEAIIDGYEVGSGKAMYSANFGILFNTPSLRQIAEKAFGEREFNKYLIQIENGLFMDPYRENVYFLSKENYLRDYPKHINAIKNVLLESEVFIFTAGLNECWQVCDGTVISRNPRKGFHHLIDHKVLTVEENIHNIVTFFNIVKHHNPKFKLILTLSPVPLLATGRSYTHHIIEANTHSKAVLRVALEEVVKQHKDIYYLPSYEMVTECTKNPWLPDHRHVTPETVESVVDMFKEMYVN